MADTSHTRSASPSAGYAPESTERMTGWAGWVAFAGVMLIVVGCIQAIQGLVALFYRSYYLVGPNGLVVSVDYTAWGWVHLALGIVAVAVGIGLFYGNIVARVAGVALAVLSAILNVLFIAAYPVWSVIVVAVDIIVIYAIVVHGRELKV